MFKSESLVKLAPALLKAQKNMGAALKDAKNPFFKSRFADLNSVIDAAIPVLNEAGIAVLQTPSTSGAGEERKPVIQTILLHESGEFILSETDIVCARSNDPQAYGSAVSYARRYGLQATVTLKAEDDDGEANMNRKFLVGSTVKEDGTVKSIAIGKPDDMGVTNNTIVTETPKKKVSFSKKTYPTPEPVNTDGDL